MDTVPNDITPDEIGDAGTSEGHVATGEAAAEAIDADTEALLDPPEVDLDAYLADAPDSVKREAEKRFLMQQDYTRKTQETAELRREMLEAIRESRRPPPDESAAPAEPEWTPERASKDPAGYIDWRAEQKARSLLQEMRGEILAEVHGDLGPVLREARLRQAASTAFGSDPALFADADALIPLVDSVMSNDPTVGEIAKSDPEKGFMVALAIAKERRAGAAVSARLQKLEMGLRRKQSIAPPAARAGTPTTHNFDEMSTEDAAVAAWNSMQTQP